MANESEYDFPELVCNLRRNFNQGILKTIESRMDVLRQVSTMLKEGEQELLDALYKDLRKPKVEAGLAEILFLHTELKECSEKLHKWMKPERVSGDLLNKMNTCEIRKDPLGVVLIIAPWNYPVSLLLSPMIGAISAGNCVVVKPSEVSANTADTLEKLVNRYINHDVVRIVKGGVPETTALLEQRFDHILYTGGGTVARIVMKAAAKHLTPVTLELGGKSPAIVDDTCNFDIIGKRIAWGKFSNNGQTCITVDYVLCVGNCRDKLTEGIKKAIQKFYGDNPKESNSYGRIINQRHFQRVSKLITKSKVVFGGDTEEDNLYVAPTILHGVDENDLIMQEEIFGPLLPIMEVSSHDDAIDFINKRNKPLALYVFTNDYETSQKIVNNTSSGSVCINDCIVQITVPNLPFGGVGESGMGSYKGKASFNTFSHRKSYLYKNQKMEGLNRVRYPPYDDTHWTVKWLKRYFTPNF